MATDPKRYAQAEDFTKKTRQYFEHVDFGIGGFAIADILSAYFAAVPEPDRRLHIMTQFWNMTQALTSVVIAAKSDCLDDIFEGSKDKLN